MLIYDDKMVMTFNFKEGEETIQLSDLEEAQKDQHNGSDMDCSGEPKIPLRNERDLLCAEKGREHMVSGEWRAGQYKRASLFSAF